MEHIRQFDWCYMGGDSQHFLTEEDIDNSCTERILRNQFFDPLISSDEEDDQPRQAIDWDKVFVNSRQNDQRNYKMYVPCLRKSPNSPKLSALTETQQSHCLRVVCGEYTNVLENCFMPRATKQDHKLFEDLKPIYLQEQEEFKEWAKSLWTSTHCIRALRPKPDVEKVYDAEFKLKMKEHQSLPKKYEMAAQLPLSTSDGGYNIVHQTDLINVNMNALPTVYFHELFNKRVNIVRNSTLIDPCDQHPCRFILPSESSVSNLPITEVHKELAQYALDNGASLIASETALRCLVEIDRPYTIPVTVCNVVGSDGNKQKIIVLGSEFAIQRQSSKVRTYRAFRHLLQEHLISDMEKLRVKQYWDKLNNSKANNNNDTSPPDVEAMTDEDDEDDNLVIDIGGIQEEKESTMTDSATEASSATESVAPVTSEPKDAAATTEPMAKIFTCSCKGESYERPPPRSFRKWQVRSKTGFTNFDIIVHCSHKMRNKSGEVLIEPIPEYQLELGASEQSPERIKSLALSLFLRRNATLVNVRVDGRTGDLASYECVSLEDLNKQHDSMMSTISNTIYTALSQLEGLLPGSFVLKHEPEHGLNVLLYVAREPRVGAEALSLDFDVTQLAEPDEAKCLKQAPVMTPVLLPWQKFRRVLPLAFTWNPKFVAKELPSKKPPMKNRTPPQAIKSSAGQAGTGGNNNKWPRKRKNSFKKKN